MALINKLKEMAARLGLCDFVQADTGIEKEPAITLYAKLGRREEVLHFNIEINFEGSTL